MTLTKMQAMVGVATGLLLLGGSIAERAMVLERRFAALDTRMGKLESAIKTLNATTPDERYKTLIKELMAKDVGQSAPDAAKKADALPPRGFRDSSYPADAGAPADAPAAKLPK